MAENILPTAFWVLAWVAVPLLCGTIGDFTRQANPFATLARLTDRPGLRRAVLGGPEPIRWPHAVGRFSVLYATWGRLGWSRFDRPGRRGFGGGLERASNPRPAGSRSC